MPRLARAAPATIDLSPIVIYTRQVTPPVQPLLLARSRAKFTPAEMALLVGVEEDDLLAFEREDAYPPQEFVERYATALGLSVRELLAGEEPTAVALLFRRMSREGGQFVEAVDAGLAEALGRIVRAARTVARLRAMLDEGPHVQQLRWLEEFESKPLLSRVEQRDEFYNQAADMARSVRDYLGLTDMAKIASMREVVERLGIITMFVDPGRIDRCIDGASLLSPQPAILVHLVDGGEQWWRTRMTLAHELCHLFFDRAELSPSHPRKFFVFSPQRPKADSWTSWHLFGHFEDLEARANAFAGELLAPTSGVRALIGSRDPTSPESIARVSDHFQVGLETAVNRLTNTYRQYKARQGMLEQAEAIKQARTREGQGSKAHPDHVKPGALLYDQSYVDLVMRAFAHSKIDALEARALLELRLSDELPNHEAVTPAQRAPLRARDSVARGAAEQHLYRRVGLEYFVRSIEETTDGWIAQIYRRDRGGEIVAVGALLLGSDNSVRDDSSLMAAIA